MRALPRPARSSTVASRPTRPARPALALAAALVPAAGAALAGAAAAETADVDGDGKPDTVRVEAPGQLVVERGGGGGAFVPFARSGPLTAHRLSVAGPGRPYVVALAELGGAWEGVALRWERGALRELWRGPVGPAGDDDEYEVWLEARPSGLVRWQRRRDLDRCDGAPVELFREGWDDARGGFRPARPLVRFPDAMPAVQAAPGPALGAGWYRATGATTAAGATDAGQLVPPRALDDGDPTTVWREDRGGDGTGEQFTFRTTMKGGRAAAIRIVPGAAAAARGAAAGNRITALAVIGKDAAYRVDLPTSVPATEPVVATLPRPIDGCVTVAILAVERRGAANVTALAELSVIADVELAPGGAEAVLAGQVARGGVAGESAARALAGRGAAAVTALTAALDLAGADAPARARLFAALARVRHPAVVMPVARALATGELAEGDRRAAAELLAEHGLDGQAALIAVVAGQPIAYPDVRLDAGGRLAAAEVLARTRPLALIDAAGTGEPPFRAELTRLLARAGSDALLAHLRGDDRAPDAAPPSLAAQADLWRAAGKAALDEPAPARAAAAVAMVAALEASAGTGDDAYELRYRLVAAAAALAADAELRRLLAWLARAGDDARARALRRVAAAALGGNSTAVARLALADLSGDRDAGTRLAAVRALATGADDGPLTPVARPGVTADDRAARDAADRALSTVLAADAWPELRRAAAAALGLRCARRGPRDALDDALGRDPALEVRIDALAALVTCRAPDIGPRLLRHADDPRAPLPLRDRAVALHAQLHDEPGVAAAARAQAVAALVQRLERWRSQAFSDGDALQLAVRAATALGGLGDGAAGPALVAAARDGAFPELQAAAVGALGALGPACPRDAGSILRALAQSDQRAVALAARGAVRRCGR